MKKFAVVFALASLLVSGCRENYLSEKAFYQAAQILKQVTPAEFKANPDQALQPAIEAFGKVAEQYPTTPKAAESLFNIAELRVKQKKFEDARQALAKVIPNFTGRGDLAADARFRIAQLYEIEGFWQKAEKAYWETAIYHSLQQKGLYAPLYVMLHYKKAGDKLHQDEAYQKAVEHYKRMLDQVGPIEMSAGLRNSLALTYLAQGNRNEAREQWTSVVEQFPKSAYAPLALLTTAELSWKSSQFDQAFTDYKHFFERYPHHPLAGKTAAHVGLLYQEKKEFAQAREWYQKAMDQYYQKNTTTLAEIKLLIGRAYQEEGNWNDAEKFYQEVEAKYPNTSAALQVPFMWFVHYDKLGQTENANKVLDQAIARYKKIVEEDPRSKLAFSAKQFMLSAYSQKKDWNQLLVNIDQEFQNEKSKDKKGRWLFLKALITEKNLKDREHAFTLYQDFLAHYPGHPLTQVAKSHQELLTKTAVS